jgi:peptidoglycan/LPS O-acetylase OafA/YrhL
MSGFTSPSAAGLLESDMPTPRALVKRGIPSLDGLRAISIAFVLLAHLTGTRNFPAAARFLELTRFGTFGVRIFFVISGYLITSLLLKELDATGTMSLRRFYFRRMLRLFPAA